LNEFLASRFPPPNAWSVEEEADLYRIRFQTDVDEGELDAALAELAAHPDLRGSRMAEIVELDNTRTRPVKVKRGKHEAWCYVGAPMKFLLTEGRLVVGDKVLVVFVDGDRSKPVIVG